MSSIKNVTVAGGGVMGSQVAWMAAWHGKNVTVYDAFEKGVEKCESFHQDYAEEFVKQRGESEADCRATHARLSYTTDLAEALADSDLVIEQVPEDLKIKQEFWESASKKAPEKTIFCTNTSSLLPSEIAPFVDRPEKFTTLHFAPKVWESNFGEIMMHPGTGEESFNEVVEYAAEMGLIAVPIRKEHPGYVCNSLLIPFLTAGFNLVRKGIADPETIDRVWGILMEVNMGPMSMADKAGMQANYHVQKAAAEAGNKEAAEIAEYLKAEFIDTGNLGVSTGKGFYEYPNPTFEKKDFLRP